MTIAAVLYARVSSKEQEQEGYSIPAQLKLLHEYAVSKNFRVMEEFVDVETAKTVGRKRFGEMLEFLKLHLECRTVIVEKTDRLYRNFKDYVTLEDLDVEIHLPKEGQVISKDSKSQTKFMHGIQVLMARNYIENLREEVRKGMREKAEQGIFPGRPPMGYRNNKAEHTIEIDPKTSEIVKRLFDLYGTGKYSLAELRKSIRNEFGRTYQKGYLHKLLRNPFYSGFFEWDGKTYPGTHETFISAAAYERVQAVLRGHNRPRYRRHEFAFSGLLKCAHDDCTVTAEQKKGKYVYYHCSGYRGKCDLPYYREEELGDKLGQVLKDIHVPDEVLAEIVASLKNDQQRSAAQRDTERQKLHQRLTGIRRRIDQAYMDKLDGKIPESFWDRKQSEWQAEEQQVTLAMRTLEQASPDRVLTAARILELANKAYFLYVTQNSAEQGKLLKTVLSNCAIDGASLYPTYRKPFDVIFERAKTKEWRPWADSNCRPTA